MKRILALTVAMLMAAAVFGQGTIKIGATWPLSDITGKQGTMSAQLAVEEINKAGGLLGKKLELIVIDDELKADKGAAAIEKLVTVDKVELLVGGMASGVALGQIPAMKKYGLPVVSTGAASYKVEEALGADADWYFHLHPWDYNQGQSYVDGWAAIRAKYAGIKMQRIFLAYEEGAFGKASYDASKALFAKEYAFDGAPFKSAAAGGGDYSSVLEAAKDFKPDLFYWAGYDADALPILEQSKAMKFVPGMYLGSPPGWPAGFGNSPLADNVMLYGMWAPSMNDTNAASKKYSDAFKAKYGEEPATYFAPLSYSAIYVVAEAIKRAGTTEPKALIKALEATKYASPMGELITFTPSNIIKHQGIKRQKILQWQKGKQEVIWPFEAQTKGLIYPFPAWK
ncbi:MAG: ABC transporter substrate-binding protein [Rectinemataceae bacterium]|nr:ABC transporter substrate-binding protein [Rectinemataceae bacterium]